jgi:hypothetical protein
VVQKLHFSGQNVNLLKYNNLNHDETAVSNLETMIGKQKLTED